MPKYNSMPSRNEKAPPIPTRWQEQLTKLLGLTPDGRPKLRLVWGQEVTHFLCEHGPLKYIRLREPVFAGWQEIAKDETTGEMKVVNRHPPTLEPPTVGVDHILQPLSRMETIGIDRWFIELWRGPRIAGGNHTPESWDRKHRFKYLYDPTKSIYRMVDVHGEFPHNGEYAKSPYYWPWMIARHCREKSCCKERDAQGYVCLGEYRPPEQRDIDYIEFLIREKENEPHLYGYDEVAPVEAVYQGMSDMAWQDRREEERRESEERYRLNQIARRRAAQPVHFDIRRNV